MTGGKASGRSWGYRVVHREATEHGDPSGWYALHEVHYDDGVPVAATESPVSFACDGDEGPEGIVASLELALADARRWPVLEYADLAERPSGGPGRA